MAVVSTRGKSGTLLEGILTQHSSTLNVLHLIRPLASHIPLDSLMMIRVLLFGPEAAAAGASSLSIDAGDRPTCASLADKLRAVHPALAPHLTSARFAINHEFAPPDRPVSASDEVALIGLVSGG